MSFTLAKTERLAAILSQTPVIPVLTFSDAKSGLETAKALRDGGLTVLEVTMRTPKALEALKAIVDEVEGVTVGAGTILEPEHVQQAIESGASFLVSPGSSSRLLGAASEAPVPWLPGVSTVSEAMQLSERGATFAKFFPAGPAGGPAFLKSLVAPLPELHFVPTGGIDMSNVQDYLKLRNVACCGGSWVAPQDAIDAGDWGKIQSLAKEAAALKAR
ncbi:bifunctional 4-hydroxy-2-oxoglutarate aldolase/2-dehydro-3-deoxy-phosphogluconate aldolase [Chenggangzhangella methanolivorans]|uniref:Bifunctional 4-hydroxy-2-oxoglutarate aldolase/2-dehydro-3-deoxy-phosphogluconate aldolase n=1 Tax=Chenggangzhangella methanolivorans TaxID=1437009 RepID=A0A9E6RIY2_9HYPH|nr:bifunctional 4-hydroxy-2-oxoglutarate aldolase/2-dehydro-3-deoxy-phosphogluconate aldolase [Chenggangzhangella methanolivorans]QZO01852.1 bifunctional 4-hydroxy-2-oxoglutarate aldolase/2-dehydro-3-deoxy-phosphogluconate aldolase [Chenggangzhangella methanolivorans]